MHYVHPSIKKEGLKNYLDRTSEDHNGFGYTEFLKLLKAKVPVMRLAAAFRVHRITMKKWIDIHELETWEQEETDEAALEKLRDV